MANANCDYTKRAGAKDILTLITIVMVIGGLVWSASRLSGQIDNNAHEIQRLEDCSKNKLEKDVFDLMQKDLDRRLIKIEASLSRIEDRLTTRENHP